MSESVGDRIKQARKRQGLTQPELTTMCGWESQGRISNYERGLREPKRTDLERIAKALNVSVAWLWTGSESAKEPAAPYAVDNAHPLPRQAQFVPEISWVQAGVWTDVGFVEDLTDARQWPCPVECSSRTFALRVEGDSMAPYYPQGSIIFVDPEVNAISGKKVVAKLVDENKATFKQFIEDGGQKMLKAMNPNWPQQYIPINGNCEIIGTVVFAGSEV